MGATGRFLGNLRIWPGPVLAVEVITATRRTRHFVLRTAYAAALFIALATTYLETFRSSFADTNSSASFCAAFFAAFGVMQLAAVLLIGPALAAGAIALERERRTIEYLYATPLSNLEIIIGKLGGQVLKIVFFVLSGVPVLALAMLMGGIAPQAVFSLAIITLSTVFFVATVSIAVSVWAAKVRGAVVLAYLAFFCLWVLPTPISFLLARLGSAAVWFQPVMEQLSATNPVVTFMEVRSGGDSWQMLLAMIRNQLLAGGIALIPAVLFMRRIHLREAGKAARKRGRRRPLFQFRGQIGDNPMYWKELYAESGSWRLGTLGFLLLALIFIVVCGTTICFFFTSLGQPSTQNGESYCYYAIGMSTFLCCCGLLLLIARAAGSITSERERDCWTSLISTPLESGEIIKAKILGSIWSLRGLAPLLVVVWLPAILLRPSYILGIAFSLLDLAILAAFAAALGIYCSQTAATTLRATGAALGIAGLLGGVSSCCCGLLMPFSPAFLLAGPGIASLTIGSMTDYSFSPLILMGLGAYLIGTISYAVAARVLMVKAIGQFDKKNGRVLGRFAESWWRRKVS
jgi:ABC-type transport system involved in multi-copper enzyme maturation permease subunit